MDIVVLLIFGQKKLQKIVDKNSLQDMDDEVDKNLINTEGNKEKELGEYLNLVKVIHMMIVL